MPGVSDLPDDLVRRLLSFVGAKDILTFRGTNKKFNSQIVSLIDEQLVPFQEYVESYDSADRISAKMELFVAIDGPLLLTLSNIRFTFINLNENLKKKIIFPAHYSDESSVFTSSVGKMDNAHYVLARKTLYKIELNSQRGNEKVHIQTKMKELPENLCGAVGAIINDTLYITGINKNRAEGANAATDMSIYTLQLRDPNASWQQPSGAPQLRYVRYPASAINYQESLKVSDDAHIESYSPGDSEATHTKPPEQHTGMVFCAVENELYAVSIVWSNPVSNSILQFDHASNSWQEIHRIENGGSGMSAFAQGSQIIVLLDMLNEDQSRHEAKVYIYDLREKRGALHATKTLFRKNLKRRDLWAVDAVPLELQQRISAFSDERFAARLQLNL